VRGNRTAVRFEGTPPPIKPGDSVEIRDANGEWHRAVARSEPRYDWSNAIGRLCYLTVSVTSQAIEHAWTGPVNWPAEDVRPTGAGEVASGG
jgi:hypothetical protein